MDNGRVLQDRLREKMAEAQARADAKLAPVFAAEARLGEFRAVPQKRKMKKKWVVTIFIVCSVAVWGISHHNSPVRIHFTGYKLDYEQRGYDWYGASSVEKGLRKGALVKEMDASTITFERQQLAKKLLLISAEDDGLASGKRHSIRAKLLLRTNYKNQVEIEVIGRQWKCANGVWQANVQC